MTKKDYIAIADALRDILLHGPIAVHETGKPTRTIQGDITNALCSVFRADNPAFKENRWRDYLAGKCGKNGGRKS